jgi:hypothetical protein
MENELRQTIERQKVKAEDFLNNNIRAFIIDIKNTYYFCDIIFVGDAFLFVQSFKGSRMGMKEKIYWADITKFEEYKDKEELG